MMGKRLATIYLILTAAICLIAATLTGCNANGEFDPAETGQAIIDTADAIDETLDQSPAVDVAVGDEIRTTTVPLRLVGELLLGLGVVVQTLRVKRRNNAIQEIDNKDGTPKAEDQVSSDASKKLVRSLT